MNLFSPSIARTGTSILQTSLLLIVLLVNGCDIVDPVDATQTNFIRVFGGSGDDAASVVRQTSDGGFIIVGTTSSFGAGKTDVYLIKTDAGGGQQWQRTYGGESDDAGADVRQTSDGGYIIVGSTISFSAGGNDLYVIRTDAVGDTLWTRSFGGSSDDLGVSVETTSDGGYVVGGSLRSPPSHGSSDFWVLKLSADGEREWEQALGGSGEEICAQVRQTAGGGYIAVGRAVTSSPTSSTNPNVALLDASGAKIVDVRTVVGLQGGAVDVQPTSDGRFTIVGFSRQTGSTDSLYVFQLDSTTRRKEWAKNYGRAGGNRGNCIRSTDDGGYVMAGYSGVPDGGRDFYLVKVDSSGTEEWSNTYGQSEDDEGYSVQPLRDGGYIMVGTSRSFINGSNGTDILLIRVNARGELH